MDEEGVTRLRALDFKRDIANLTQDFTGRRWLFDEVSHWLEHGRERFFLLTGEPGIGKSAVAARLTQIRDDLIAYHFCIAGRNSTIIPGTVLRSLAAQLGADLPVYGLALANTIKPEFLSVDVKIDVATMNGGQIAGAVINNLTAPEPEDVLDILLRAPLAELDPPARPLLILIDSLDEAVTYQRTANLVRLLAKASDLPGWLRFFCTSRPERRVLQYFGEGQVKTLAAESQLNQQDLRHYVAKRAAGLAIQTRLEEAGLAAEKFVDHVAGPSEGNGAGLSDGNFLYTKILLDDVETEDEDRRLPLQNLARLPKSLDEIYHRFLQRFTDSEWKKEYQPLLEVLTVAQEPITEAQLATFTACPRGKLRQYIGVLVQFLDVVEDGRGTSIYRLFHQSFRDYLGDEERNLDFWCAPEDGHRRVASACLKRCRDKWAECDEYCRTYTAVHLAGAEMWQAFARLARDPLYILAADPNQLLRVMETAPGRMPPKFAQVYKRAVHHLRANPLPEATSYLELSARQSGANDLAQRIAQLDLQQPWSTPWVRWQRAQTHQVLTRHQEGYVQIARAELDGRPLVVSASEDIRVIDMENGDPAGEPLKGHPDRVRAVITGELNGRPVIVSGGTDGIWIWDLANRSPLQSPAEGFSEQVNGLAMGSLSGRPVIVAGCQDGTVRVWDPADRRQHLEPLAGHKAKVYCVTTGEWEGRPIIVSGGQDKTIRLWDLTTGEPLGEPLSGHTGWVEAVAITRVQGRTVIVSGGAFEEGVRVWDIGEGRQISTHSVIPAEFAGNSAIYAVDVGEIDGRLLAVTGSYSKHIQFWNLVDGAPTGAPLAGHDGPVKSVMLATLNDRPVVVSGGNDGTVRVWDLADALASDASTVEETVIAHSIAAGELEGRAVICVAGFDWRFRILDQATGALIGEALDNPIEVYPDPQIGGRYAQYTFGLLRDRPVIILQNLHELQVWDAVKLERIGKSIKLDRSIGNLGSIRLTKHNGRPAIIATSWNKEILVGDLDKARLLAVWRGIDFSTAAANELDGRFLVAVGEHGKESPIRLLNLPDRAPLGQFMTHHEGYISAVGFGRLGGRPAIISGGSEGNLKVWQVEMSSTGGALSIAPAGETPAHEIQLGARIDDILCVGDSNLVLSTSKGIVALQFQ